MPFSSKAALLTHSGPPLTRGTGLVIKAAGADAPRPRWKFPGLPAPGPTPPFVRPVRDPKVMYGLKTRHYQVATGTLPHPHEYFVPMDALTAVDGDKNPALQAMVARACTAGNFLTLP